MDPLGNESNSPDDTFFNDLSQAPGRPSPPENGAHAIASADNESQPRAKRIACILCRKRKLKCDGARPKCGTCTRLSHECGYDEVRKKSGPKRGYVKLLEQRLQQVETLLKSQDTTDRTSPEKNDSIPVSLPQNGFGPSATSPFGDPDLATLLGPVNTSGERASPLNPTMVNPPNSNGEPFPWEMIGLGLEEPLPTQDVINELHQIYFEKIHPSMPMIHRPRYLAAMNLAPNMRPPICLRYIIWTHAASISEKYEALAEHFYRRARKYAEIDEMRGHGESIITLAHCQTWVLMSLYEFKNMYFPRAWQGTRRAVSLALMMGLNRLDGAGLDVKQCLPPPKDWTEKEERRRTFWMCFNADRYASIGTGWPMSIDERDIMTLLPASEESYEKSKPTLAPSLEQAFRPSAVNYVSAMSGVTLITCLLGRNLTHLHRPTPQDNEEDLNGAFWQRHRQLEQLLSNISLALPDHLRIPTGLPDANVIFMNMLLHTSVICLHQAAIFKADKNHLPQSVISESRSRCVAGAAEITRIMKTICHLDLSRLNPFLAFCLYVAARVFVQYLKWRPKDSNMVSSLQFLGSAMHALKRKNPLTESFLAQLEVDLEGTGIDLGQGVGVGGRGAIRYCPDGHPHKIGILVDIDDSPKVPSEMPVNTDALKCSPLFEIRESQAQNSADPSIFRSRDFVSRASDGTQQPPAQPRPDYENIQINIDVDNSYAHMSAQDPMQFALPERGKTPQYGGRVSLVDSMGSDMSSEQHKSRSNSTKDSSSHASFTPPSQSDDMHPQYQNPAATNSTGASKPSPQTIDSSSSIGTPGGVSSAGGPDPMMFIPDASFSGLSGGNLFGSPFMSNGSINMPTGWAMGGMDGAASTMEGTTTGLTPMPDTNFDFLSADWGAMNGGNMTGYGNSGSGFGGESHGQGQQQNAQ